MRRIMVFSIVFLFAILSGCGEEHTLGPELPARAKFFINFAPTLAGKVTKVTAIVKAHLEDDEPLVEQDLQIDGNKAYGEVNVPAGEQRVFIIELRAADGTLLAKSIPQQRDVPAGEEITLNIKIVFSDTGIVKINVTWDDEPVLPPPDIRIIITDPKPNDQVPVKYTIKGRIDGINNLQELIDKLGISLSPGEELKIYLWVWAAADPHGPWEQPPAAIAADGTWQEDTSASFGRAVDIGVHFNVRAQLVKVKGAIWTAIEGVDKAEVGDIIRR